MTSVAGLHGVDVSRHDPKLDHVAGFKVVAVDGGDTEKVCGFVENVHMGLLGFLGLSEAEALPYVPAGTGTTGNT
jgi:hypothetical protein